GERTDERAHERAGGWTGERAGERTDERAGRWSGERSRTGMGRDDAMTRSEERLHVGVESREVGRARLRKYVVTEEVEQTVPLRHDEVRVEREPITDANRDAALTGPEIGEAEYEVILHEERPVVETETVPVERVRLTTEEHISEETVRARVRKEHIKGETEGFDEARDDIGSRGDIGDRGDIGGRGDLGSRDDRGSRRGRDDRGDTGRGRRL
ncbi:YsnF/AvaK domain-containing protein, partial [Streptomyces seoulensis]